MPKVWTFYECQSDKTHPQSQEVPQNAQGLAIVAKCIDLLKATAAAHIGDFPNTEPNWPNRIRNRVNNLLGAEGKNWIKLRCRFEQGTPEDIDIVIAYHLLQHRNKRWCVSVGFNQGTILPNPPDQSKGPNDQSYPYVTAATDLFNKIRFDMEKFNTKHWYSIDSASNLSEKETDLRSTRIGELMFIGEKNIEIRKVWRTVAKSYIDRPTNENGTIPGWGGTNDQFVLVTKVSTDSID